MDTVADFFSGTNWIDQSRINAAEGTVGNQAFSFIADGAFAAVGQVRASLLGAHVMLEINTADKGGAEMVILVAHTTTLFAGDFVL